MKFVLCPSLALSLFLIPLPASAQQSGAAEITGGPSVPATPAQAPKTPPTPDEHQAITVALATAEKAQREGDYIGALDALWRAQEMVWRRAPLGVRNVAFVTEPPEGFGTYNIKPGEDFKSPEPLILYCEPVGFTQIKEGDTYRYSIIGAFDIIDAEGRVLGGQKNLGPYEQSGYRTFSMETMLTMTIGIHGLPRGSYIMRVTFTDNLDPSKSVQLDKPFNVLD
ncbi:hypothetical protein LJB99_02640 [Deltaproteobacteria bacterium OttesenSCG-928-K17]|nr:hypothetical protein [Deltaproteobacteria bacterium OttesenSCG-928-K17]